MRQHDPLLTPFQLRHLTLKNRVMSTSHAPAYVEDSMPALRYQLYHEEKAKGGMAMTMFGGSSTVAPDSPSAFGQINASTDAVIPHFRTFADRIHQHGAALMCQISHMGHRTFWNVEDWLPPVAPSLVREPQHRAFPKVLEKHDIQRIVEAYGEAARRCKEGGLDGVEVLAHGHLIGQFWNPLVNQRDDAYGGDFQRRLRFGKEVFEAIRRKVGDDFIVGLRLAGDEMRPGGLDRETCLEIAHAHGQSGHVDFFNVNGASIESDEALARHLPGMISPAAPFLHLASAMRKEVGLPVFHACRVSDVATARHAIGEDHVDMVGMTRAHLADPYIVAKLSADREADIRPCVGAGYCIDRIYEGGEALCLHNAATGRERSMPHVIEPADDAKKIVVVGGGPGGLEAARVCAERGHRVVLFEATTRTGGQVLLAARAGWRKDLIGITDWLSRRVEQLGVDIHTNTFADEQTIAAQSPDVVIIATGGVPNVDWLPGNEHTVSVWDILSGNVKPGGEVLLFDDNGQHQGPSCAEVLAQEGAKVEVATPDRTVAQEMGSTNYPVYMRHLYERGVTLTPDRKLIAVRRAGNRLVAELSNVFTRQVETREVDQVVVEHGTAPSDALYFELCDGSANGGATDYQALIAGEPQPYEKSSDGTFRLYRIGDAMASRNIHAAIYDSLRLCKNL